MDTVNSEWWISNTMKMEHNTVNTDTVKCETVDREHVNRKHDNYGRNE
jgi:hypothetical protein